MIVAAAALSAPVVAMATQFELISVARPSANQQPIDFSERVNSDCSSRPTEQLKTGLSRSHSSTLELLPEMQCCG